MRPTYEKAGDILKSLKISLTHVRISGVNTTLGRIERRQCKKIHTCRNGRHCIISMLPFDGPHGSLRSNLFRVFVATIHDGCRRRPATHECTFVAGLRF